MAISNKSQVYGQIAENLKGLTEGVVLSIDPSCGSSNSMPGWAVYKRGTLTPYVSGRIELPLGRSLPDRLRFLSRSLTKLYIQHNPDVLVYEEIPAQRHGMGNANAHSSLLKALGAILCTPGPEGFVGIHPISWKALKSEEYVKGDEADAVEMGRIVIEEAWRQLEASKNKKEARNGSRRNK